MKKLKMMLIAAGLMTSLSFANCYAMERSNKTNAKDSVQNFTKDSSDYDEIFKFKGKDDKIKTYTQSLQNKLSVYKLKDNLMDKFYIQGLRDKIYELEIYNNRFKQENAELEKKVLDQKEKEKKLLNEIEDLKKFMNGKDGKILLNRNSKYAIQKVKEENKKLKEENKQMKNLVRMFIKKLEDMSKKK